MNHILTVAPLGGADMSTWCGGWAKRSGVNPDKIDPAHTRTVGNTTYANVP